MKRTTLGPPRAIATMVGTNLANRKRNNTANRTTNIGSRQTTS